MKRRDLIAALDGLLRPGDYADYAPNGLQVEGRDEIRSIVCGVTACAALIDQAVLRRADAIVVHHGWFWKREDPRVTGVKRARMASVLAGGLNLIAYHLPLDGHPELGNNVLFGQAIGAREEGSFGDQGLGRVGGIEPMPLSALCARVGRALDRTPFVVGPSGDPVVSRPAWCTGGAQDMLEEAASMGADCFLSGEISERTTHLARELGIPYLACGHHATERFGIRALGAWITRELGVPSEFVNIDNPV